MNGVVDDDRVEGGRRRNNNNTLSSNVFASGSNMNSSNVITDRPSTKVRNPPGGRSSIVFG